MKGIILAGGSGARLYPLTLVTSKQPIYAVDPTKLRLELVWHPEHADNTKDFEQTIEWCRANERWWHPQKDTVGAKYAKAGQ